MSYEFSVSSVDPDARKPKVDLAMKETVNPVATPLSRSSVRLFRKVFGQWGRAVGRLHY